MMKNLVVVAFGAAIFLAAGLSSAQAVDEAAPAGEQVASPEAPAPEAGGPEEGTAEEEECSALAGGVDLAVNTAYIWRGVELNPEGVFQSEIWLEAFGLGGRVWGNLDLSDYHDERGEFNEFDFEAFYSLMIDDLSATLSYVYYHYPLSDYEKTQEVTALLSWGAPLSVNLQASYDFDLVKGTYLKPSVSYEVEAGFITITPEVGMGWASANSNESNFGVDRDGLSDLTAGIEFCADIIAGAYVAVRGEYYALVDHRLREETGSAKEGIWGGASLGYEF